MSHQRPSRVIAFPAPRAGEPWLSRKRLAEHFQVSEGTVQRWQADGMPCIGRGHTVRYRASAAEAWLEGGQ
jgi:phage terminase Nu1 subunit (DNA packaging protein)